MYLVGPVTWLGGLEPFLILAGDRGAALSRCSCSGGRGRRLQRAEPAVTTLVTGATGFVGSAVARALLAAGEPVRALVRPNSARGLPRDLPVEPVVGDLDDPASLAAAVAGVAAVFHVAADYRLWVPEPAAMYRTNVDGTRALLVAAAEAGVRRIVYTSSVATLGLCADGSPADETTPATLAGMIGHYKRSKYLAELAVRELIDQHGLPAVIVNPSAPIGPGDVAADADRADGAGGGARAVARLCRHRPQRGPRRRRRGRASLGASSAGGSASATSSAARTCRSARS